MTTVGALNKYIHDYTNCINNCDFYTSDKTKRLGYDNNMCLLRCNSYFTSLRKNGFPTERICFQDNETPIPFLSYDSSSCNNLKGEKKLKCLENQYQIFTCKKQCDLNGSFFSPFQKQVCYNLCETKQNYVR